MRACSLQSQDTALISIQKLLFFRSPRKDKRVLMEDAADARYVRTGHLVFVRQGVLYAVPFDLAKLQVYGQPEPVAADIMQALNTGSLGTSTTAAQSSFSDSGNLLFVQGGIVPDAQRSVVWVDFKGTSQEIAPFKGPFSAPRLSPDGQKIAYFFRAEAGNLDVPPGAEH